jgi:hypothetical protein
MRAVWHVVRREPARPAERQGGMRIVTLLLLAAMLAGCRMLADGPGAGGGDRSGNPDDPVVSSPDPSAGEPPSGDRSLREEPNPKVVNEHTAAVDHFRIGPDGRTLVIYWWGGTPACFALKEVLVEVQRGTPIVTVLEGTLPEAVGKACTMEAVLKSTVVTLDDPILVDGSGNQHEPGEPMVFEEGAEVDPRADLTDSHEIAITGYRLDADGTRLQAHFVGGTERCYGLAEASAVARDGVVTVTIAEGTLPDVDGPCEDIGVAKFTTLKLDEPLIVQAAFNT